MATWTSRLFPVTVAPFGGATNFVTIGPDAAGAALAGGDVA
jgi:hypothetical protein